MRSLVLAVLATCALAQPRPSSAAWPPCGRPVVTAPRAQVHAAIATDGADGAIVVWQDARSARVNVFAQHLLANGEVDGAWPAGGRALLTDSLALPPGGQTAPAIVPDGAGGAIVAWQDNRSSATDTDLFAQHVLASGIVDPDWKANGVALCLIAGVQNTFVMVPDGAGGALVAWMDDRPGATVKDIFAQHVLASGIVDPRWPENGLAIGTAPGLQELPAIVEDGAGGAIIAWDDARASAADVDVYAQHVLAAGTIDRAWPADGRALCTAPGGQGGATIASDGAHGAIVAWTDARIEGTAHIFAQHVFGSGALDPAWPADGRAVSAAAVIEGRPQAVADGAGGVLVNWEGFTVELNMYLQHVPAAGVVDPVWPPGGRALSDSDRQQTFAAIVPDGTGGAIVAWDDSIDVVAQHVLATGALDPAYPDTGRAVCDQVANEGDPALVATGGGGAIVAWTDFRNGASSGTDIFALQVLAAGTVDAPPPPLPLTIAFAPPRPNPAHGALTLRFALPRAAHVRLAIYDTAGRRVRELAAGTLPAGESAVAWDLRGERGDRVDAGIYVARLEVEGRALTRKVVTL
jgi:hypothetical protein